MREIREAGAKTACVTLEDVLMAASVRAASLVPETSGYLVLALADATSRLPLAVEDRAVLLTTEGNVNLARRGAVLPGEVAAAGVRDVLARLLQVSVGSMPGLASAARPRAETAHGVEGVARDLEAALIPVNRQAARRALARLARETSRAREMGKLKKPQRDVAANAVDAAPPPSRRAQAVTLVGHAPQPVTAPVREASRPDEVIARAVTASRPSFASSPLLLTKAIAPPPAPSAPAATSEDEVVDAFDGPFVPTPTAFGMHAVWIEEAIVAPPNPSIAAPPPRPAKTVLETAPWRALDEAAIAALLLDEAEKPEAAIEREDKTELDAALAVSMRDSVSEAPPSSEGPELDLYVEDLSSLEGVSLAEAEAALAREAPTVAPGRVIAAPPADEPVALPDPVVLVALPEPSARLEQTPSPFTDPLGAAAVADVSAAPEQVESCEVSEVVSAAPEPAEATAALADEAPAATEPPAIVEEPSGVVETQPMEAAAVPAPEPAAPTIENTPYLFDLLRRAAAGPSPMAAPAAVERTRADDLIERFGSPSSDDSVRAAASSLKTLIGLSPTPPPSSALVVLERLAATAASLDPLRGPDSIEPPPPGSARPPGVEAPFAPMRPNARPKRRLSSSLSTVAFFALGLLVAGAALAALRPDIVSDIAQRVGKAPPPPPAAAAPAPVATEGREANPPVDAASHRVSPRAGREPAPARARAGN